MYRTYHIKTAFASHASNPHLKQLKKALVNLAQRLHTGEQQLVQLKEGHLDPDLSPLRDLFLRESCIQDLCKRRQLVPQSLEGGRVVLLDCILKLLTNLTCESFGGGHQHHYTPCKGV